MAFVVTKLVLFSLILVIHLFILPSSQVQRESDLPAIDPGSNVRYQYYSSKKTRSSPRGKVIRVRVYDELVCLQYCTRMAGSCLSVYFDKGIAENNPHVCEIATTESHDSFEKDGELNHMSPVFFSYHSCAEVPRKISGVYHIRPFSFVTPYSVAVFCDMTTTVGGWTVIQKRMDGSVDFYRNWDDYKWGFGNKFGEYWLGLENIHAMTSQRSYRLRVDLEDFGGNTRYAEYGFFLVSTEADNYRLTLDGTFSGTAGDSLNFHNGMQFTTKDRDNDRSNANCAVTYTGAWWYNDCHVSNPNGQYLGGPGTANGQGINWNAWLGYTYSLKRIELKIRPV